MSTSRRLRPPRVLLFDDREAIGIQIEKLVWRSGGAATRVTTLEDAIAHSRRHSVDIAFVRQDAPGNQGVVAALGLPEIDPSIRIFLFGERIHARLATLAKQTGRTYRLIREGRLSSFVPAALPILARAVRDERRVRRICGHEHLARPCDSASTLLPVNLRDLGLALEESFVRAAVEHAYALHRPSIRKAAELLGLRESVMRSKMRKLGVPWSPPT